MNKTNYETFFIYSHVTYNKYKYSYVNGIAAFN